MKFLSKLNANIGYKNNQTLSRLLTFIICILVLIVYRNLGQFLLTDRFIRDSPFAAEVGYQESHLLDEIISMKKLSSSAKLTSFRMSSLLSSDEARYQRVLEFLYPIRENSQSKFLFVMKEEKVHFSCEEMGQDSMVVLYYCK